VNIRLDDDMTGDEIKKLRTDRGWSQKQLGDYLGVEQATISRLERDEWKPSGPVQRLLALLASQASVSLMAVVPE